MTAEQSNFASPRQLAILAIIVLLAAYLRFDRIGAPSLWMDELVSIELAMGNGTSHDFFPDAVVRTDHPDPLSLTTAAPWWHIWNHVQITTHPPVYFLVLRWWIDFFGTTAAATRSLSAILSLAGIVVFFDLCRLLHGTKIALLSAAIMALAISQVDIAQESRSYPLLILVGLSSCDVLVRMSIVGTKLGMLTLLAVLLATMLLTHYFAAGAFAALAIFAMLKFQGRERFRAFSAFIAAALIAVAAWSRQLYWQTRSVPNFDPSYVRESSPHHAVHVLLRLAELPLRYFCGDSIADRLPITIHLAAAAIIAALIVRPRLRSERLLWILWAGGVILPVAALDLLHHSTILQIGRYTLLASPAIFALVASCNWPRRKYLSEIFPSAIIASLAVLAGIRAYRGVPAKQDFQHLSQIIDAYADPHELLVFYNDSGWVAPGVWYMAYEYYSPNSKHPWMTIRHPADAKLLYQLSSNQTFWLIGPAPEQYGAALFPGWQPETVWHTTAGGVCLMRKRQQPDSVR